MGFGEVGLEPDRLAELGDRLVELPLAEQGEAEVVVGLWRCRARAGSPRGTRRWPRPASPGGQGGAEVAWTAAIGRAGAGSPRGTRRWPRPASPGRARARPRLAWAVARSGSSRIASRNSAMASSSFPGVRRAIPRLEWAQASSGCSRIAARQRRLGPVEDLRPLRRPGRAGFSDSAQACRVPAIVRPQPSQVAEHGDRLVRLARPSRAWRQLVGRLGADGPGRRVVADRLVARRPRSSRARPGRS